MQHPYLLPNACKKTFLIGYVLPFASSQLHFFHSLFQFSQTTTTNKLAVLKLIYSILCLYSVDLKLMYVSQDNRWLGFTQLISTFEMYSFSLQYNI